MKRYAILAIIVIAALCRTTAAQFFPWQDTTKSLDERVEWLIQNLTLDEKLSLMVHQNPAIPRVGLPAYSWWNEALHGVGRAGYATVYPMPIAMAATFNPAMIRNVFNNVALEARIKYQQAQDKKIMEHIPLFDQQQHQQHNDKDACAGEHDYFLSFTMDCHILILL